MPDLGPAVAQSAAGDRLHLQHGPIDLLIECDGDSDSCGSARRAAVECFDGLLEQLVEELAVLRMPLDPAVPMVVTGPVARRMVAASSRHSHDGMLTPMSAVAGAVADEVASSMADAARLDRWMVNNGGDIAFGLAAGQSYRLGMVIDPRRGEIGSAVELDARSGVRGIATSGRHGRSFSLGIADAVSVFATSAADADVAATIIANRVDVGAHPEIERRPARQLDPDSDLGEIPVTIDVGVLTTDEVRLALHNGLGYAERCVDRGLISGAVLHLGGMAAATGSELLTEIEQDALSGVRRVALS